MGHASGVARRTASGKSRYREVEAAPEEVHRACLAEKAGAELLEYRIGVDQNMEKALHRVRIVGGVSVVLRKADRLRYFVRHPVDLDPDTEFGERGERRGEKTRDRFSGQSKLALRAVTVGNAQDMIKEVEVELERPAAVGDRRGRQAARRHVERDMPRMIQPGCA